MEVNQHFLNKLVSYGVGRRKLDDVLFIHDKPPQRLGLYENEELFPQRYAKRLVDASCDQRAGLFFDQRISIAIQRGNATSLLGTLPDDSDAEDKQYACVILGCKFTAQSSLELENHYNGSHRYSCSQCKIVAPSPYYLDLHIQETHDSFFAVLAKTKPSYCCYIEGCKLKFMTPDERLMHSVIDHKLPKDFRYDKKPKNKNKKKGKAKQAKQNEVSMELDSDLASVTSKLTLATSKQKTFTKYSGRKLTENDSGKTAKDTNMDDATDLKESMLE